MNTRRLVVRLVPSALLALAVLGAPARGQLKISQIYGGGGELQAPVVADYVEIYNPTGSPVLMSNWSVQYATGTGSTWLVATLNGTVPSGRYFLVQLGTASTSLAPALPAADAGVPGINLAATSGKVALVNVNSALFGATPTDATIQDFVGYGTAANWREPFVTGTSANNAPQPANTLAIYRNDCGAQDTNVNNADIALGAPSPRNSVTPVDNGLTGIGSVFPYLLETLQTCSLRVTPRLCGTSALNAGTTVTVSLSTIGGAASQAMFDNGTNGDDLAGDGVFMFTATISPVTTPGDKVLPVTFSDGFGNSGGAYLLLQVTPASTPNNDNCTTAQAIPGPFPASVGGTVNGATVESNAFANSLGAPTNGFGARRGVWYSVIGTGTSMTASLCPTVPVMDSVLFVMCGTCDGLTIVGNDDDFCGTFAASQVTWCSTAGTTYYVWVAHFNAGAQTSGFTLQITQVGGPCSGAVPCSACPPPSGSGATTEIEAGYGTATNDGCDSSPGLFTNIATPGSSAVTVVGRARGMVATRDADWYRWQATSNVNVTATVMGQAQGFQVSIYSLTAPGVCPAVNLANSPLSTRCGSTSVTTSTTSGTWYAMRVIPVGISGTPTAAVFGGTIPGGLTYGYGVVLATTSPGVTFCEPGLNSVITCPCGNNPSGAGRGCDNSSFTGGASMTDVGTASLASDTVVFTTADEKPTATTIVLQGTASNGAGIAFGDGLRCADGSLKRLYVKAAVGGSITAPQGLDPAVSTQSALVGDTIAPGSTRYYMVYYRDPGISGCLFGSGATFNSSSGRRIMWFP